MIEDMSMKQILGIALLVFGAVFMVPTPNWAHWADVLAGMLCAFTSASLLVTD
jgi:drug/metabolite transporter (DMT)-like permease